MSDQPSGQRCYVCQKPATRLKVRQELGGGERVYVCDSPTCQPEQDGESWMTFPLDARTA